MRTGVACLTAVLLAGLALHTGRAQSDHEVTRAEYDRWKTELSNWGRWGADDEIGTLNLITPAKRREAAALVRDGVSVSLSLDLDTEPAVDNGSPFVQEIYGLGGDGWHIRYHGYGMTHIDALAHVFDDGATTTATSRTRRRCWRTGIRAARSTTSSTASSRAAC